ncbi:MAG: glycosyltransferase [Bacteroidales bacterium]|nr:glycosyltransferase [Bacteroidales bacterium]MCF8352530.1 glycosyltransferase [Bacteroidales bacterium]MCF8377788.1 glycosyltransferase [Bacteroidales bacterium]
MRIETGSFKRKPLISILMPVYNLELPWLKNAFASVEKQIYSNWELCIADDASTDLNVIEYLETIKKATRSMFYSRSRTVTSANQPMML